MGDQHRRKGDRDTRLLIALDERVAGIQETLKERLNNCEDDIKTTQNTQNSNPCETHGLRLRYLERIIWGVTGAVALLIVEMLISIFKN